jgi:DNA-binding MurR/RpiR family transcriptional regulator
MNYLIPGGTYVNILKILREKERFSATEQIIVDYILKNYREISYLSARELAEKTYTSSAAVVRLCQKIGLKGYVEFKIRFSGEAMQESMKTGEYQNSITNRDTIISIIDKVTRINVAAIEETRKDTEPGQIMRAAQLLDHAGHVDFYAMDNNLHIADIACYSFLHAGKLSTVNSHVNAQYVQAMASDKTHVSFFISRTGENRKLIEIAKILKQKNMKIILLTAVKTSTLGQIANEALCVATEKNFNELGTLVFLAGAKYMIDILFSVLFARHYDITMVRNMSFEKLFRV